MYIVPLVALILLAIIATAWSPVFAVVIAAIFFVAFLAYVGLRPRADEKITPPTGSAENTRTTRRRAPGASRVLD